MILSLLMPRPLPVLIVMLVALLLLKTVGVVRSFAATAEPPSSSAAANPSPSRPDKERKEEPRPPAAAAAVPARPPPPATPEPAVISESERGVLLELRQRRQDLDTRETTVVARESMLAAAEQKLARRVGELQTLQKQLEAMETARVQREENGWQGLVKLYEAMKPREAAAIFNELAMPVLLGVMDRMKEARAGPILAAMNPDKARELTAQLASTRTNREPPGTAAAKGAPSGPSGPARTGVGGG